ncbi:MAG: hypothetical protein AAF409_12585 [Pseudomonadota bacterium]
MTRTEIMARYAAPHWRLTLGTILSGLLGPVLIIGFWELSTGTWEAISGGRSGRQP